jgi:AcrR family transcriptional regulator
MTISALARAADVSVQTVYNAVGGKAEVVKAVYDVELAGDDEPVPMMQRPGWQELLAERDGREWLRRYAAFARGIAERVGPLVNVLLAQAAAGDPDMAGFAEVIERERATGNGVVVREVVARAPLRDGLTVEHAVDVVWTLTSPEVFDRLVRRREWTFDEYEAWLGQAMADALLGPAAGSRRRRR